jgi:D-sedoheptulose 7-phosphate isomerase
MIFIAGNGGLAAESEHFAAELMGKFAFDVYIPCIALTSNSALITALANDIGFENVFSHQLEVLGKEGDTFIGMTTSHSVNILKAVEAAKRKKMKVLLLDADKLVGSSTQEKQEFAIKLLHEIAAQTKYLEIKKNDK